MPLSKARDRERKRLEREAAKVAHYGLFLKREEERIRLEKLLSPPQTSKAVQPSNEYIMAAAQYLDDVDLPDEWTFKDCTFAPEIDADGNVIPEMEE